MGNLVGSLLILILSGVLLSSCSDPRLVAGPKPVPQKTTALYIKNYCPTDGYRFTEIFSYNSSSELKIDAYNQLYYHISDWDRDGLSDEFEKRTDMIDTFNVGWGLWDTNGDGHSDFLMYAIGYDTDNQVRLAFCPLSQQDTDDDGLPDCAEEILRTDYTKPDSDRDGVPDGIEYRFGTNPSDPMDVITDYDQDGISTMQELKINLPHTFTNNPLISSKGYKYDVDTFYNGTQDCYNIRISNIPVMDVANGNLIQVMAVENNTLQDQGDITRVTPLKVLVPRDIQDKLRIVIDNGIQGQVVDGISIPLVLEDDTEEPI